MDARKRGQTVLLAVLGVVFASLLAYQLLAPKTPPAAAARAGQARTTQPASRGRASANSTAGLPQVVDVRVDRLQEPPPDISTAGRNPFRFKPKAPPPPPPRAAAPPPPPTTSAGGDPSVPPPPPPPPPITLKFIGTVSGQSGLGKVAVLSDGKFVYYGREGDIIEGRYRLVRIGEESVQMEYVDGRGRQTIRLSGA
jgi:hypothetical protein